MSNNGMEQIVIRHVSGSKANQIEHISLADVTEITIGRDPKSSIAFDSTRDDIVSRRHAVIRVSRGDQISFRLADLGSNNGTFLNGRRIKGEEELLPEDLIGLGRNGVTFVFDVKPRPAYMVARTRVIDIGDVAATRVIETAGIAARDAGLARDTASEPAIQKFEPPPKVGVGKETVLHLLGEERRATSRVWMSYLAALAACVAIGGGAIYWKQVHDKVLAQAEMKKEIAQREATIESKVTEQQADLVRKTEEERGMTAQDIAKNFGNATAEIHRAWRLYDQTTGKPVFQQTFVVQVGKGKDEKRLEYPAYVDLGGTGGIVRWLTLEDDNRTNIPIGGEAYGTAFVVDENGFMLTNKHVAAAWKLSFGQEDPANRKYGYGWVYPYVRDIRDLAKHPKLKRPTLINLSDRQYAYLKHWVPSTGGYIFLKGIAHVGGPGNFPDPSKGDTKTFLGRNDLLEVTFANSRISANASLKQVSTESDAALIKVDSPIPLSKLDIAADDTVSVGEPVIALGYPAVAERTKATSKTIENGQERENEAYVPVPFVSEGIVALVSSAIKTEHEVTVGGVMGEIIQMSINSTGPGNSGGPVFNKKGKVIGLFTYGISSGDVRTSGAIPIKYGRDLFRAQYPKHP